MQLAAKNILSSIILLGGIILVLACALKPYPELLPGEISGQIYTLGISCVSFCLLIILNITLFEAKTRFYSLNFADAVSWTLIGLAVIQAVYGLGQIYGFTFSNHSLFKLTGSFYNPGPYSGYLAMIFPVALYEWLQVKNKNQRSVLEQIKYYISLFTILLILCVLPAGMSRSAWLAVIISSIFILSIRYSWIRNFKKTFFKHKSKVLISSILFFIILAGVIFIFYSIKKDSANGRLFMWKISSHAIMQKPLTGHGTNSFAIVYGNTQEEYFAMGDYTEREELVAGSPEYAFNEYLQIALEWGLPVLIIFMLIIFLCLYLGIKQKRIGICGAIVSLLVFAFSSYPFQLPIFVITFVFLLAACVIGKSNYGLGVFAFLIGCAGVYLVKNNVYEECCEWSKSRMLYQVGAYESAVKEYAELYPALNTRPAFLFEYGHAHHKLGNHESSTQIMKEAMKYSNDPMIFNIIAKNYQEQGEYEQAEYWLKRSVNRLPGRIYPYYLLAKLYAEPQFYKKEKFDEMVELVLKKEPKVQSTAIKQMRDEIMEMIYQIEE